MSWCQVEYCSKWHPNLNKSKSHLTQCVENTPTEKRSAGPHYQLSNSMDWDRMTPLDLWATIFEDVKGKGSCACIQWLGILWANHFTQAYFVASLTALAGRETIFPQMGGLKRKGREVKRKVGYMVSSDVHKQATTFVVCIPFNALFWDKER